MNSSKAYHRYKEKKEKKIASGLCSRNGCKNKLKTTIYCEKHSKQARLMEAKYRKRKAYKLNPPYKKNVQGDIIHAGQVS